MIYLLLLLLLFSGNINGHDFTIEEATISDVQRAFTEKKLTSRQLVDYYLDRIESLNPVLRGVIEVNPDAIDQAERADCERWRINGSRPLHGIPVLLKDSIATKDKLNTTGGSYALLGAAVPRDVGVVARLRNAGAVILGKASMSEWYHFRSFGIPDGWCARAGQGLNPYVKGGDPCGSSSGSAISVAANMVMVSLGTETDGSLICPGDHNSVVALKPTVGLTSRAGVIPLSPRQDTVGPISRTVSDAAHVLDAIVGPDPRDVEATKAAAKFIPAGGYAQFLKVDGLRGKRLGVVRRPFLNHSDASSRRSWTFEAHLQTLREKGATVLDDLEIPNIDVILNPLLCGEALALLAEFKLNLNNYLNELTTSPVKSLSDIIIFNQNNPDLERTNEFGQEILIAADATNGIGEGESQAIEMMEKLSRDGFEKLMLENELDAMITLGSDASPVLAIGGFPAITVPAGYDSGGMPFGIFFGGLKGTEPTLIEIAFAFEQATLVRKPPSIRSMGLSCM
ncbi:Amidase family protein [Perilla frutescens var. hirtella]|nr:Amidase family protein [Perilla frutescens var. hirtella]